MARIVWSLRPREWCIPISQGGFLVVFQSASYNMWMEARQRKIPQKYHGCCSKNEEECREKQPLSTMVINSTTRKMNIGIGEHVCNLVSLPPWQLPPTPDFFLTWGRSAKVEYMPLNTITLTFPLNSRRILFPVLSLSWNVAFSMKSPSLMKSIPPQLPQQQKLSSSMDS